MMTKLSFIRGAAAGLAALLVATSLAAPAHSQAPGAEAAKQTVSVRFSWKLKGEYAHMYVAKEKGYFADEGLDVHLGEGAGSQAALGSVLQKQDDVTLMPAVFALTAITKGMPVKIIALYHEAAPMALISWPDKPVATPKDLEGKSIATSVGETATTYLDVFCDRNNIDCDKISRVQVAPQARVPQFFSRQVDVVSVYQTNDLPILMAQHGKDFVVLDLVEHGLALPGMALVTSDELIQEKGGALAALLRAAAKGIEAARSDPLEAAKLMLRSWDTPIGPEVVAEQVKATVNAVPSHPGKTLGWVDEQVLADALEVLKQAGQIDEAKPFDAYYTNALLEAGPPS